MIKVAVRRRNKEEEEEEKYFPSFTQQRVKPIERDKKRIELN